MIYTDLINHLSSKAVAVMGVLVTPTGYFDDVALFNAIGLFIAMVWVKDNLLGIAIALGMVVGLGSERVPHCLGSCRATEGWGLKVIRLGIRNLT